MRICFGKFYQRWTIIQDRRAIAVRRGNELKHESEDLGPNTIVEGPIFPEPIEISMTVSMGESVKIIGKGLKTGRFYDPVLSSEQLETLRKIGSEMESFDGDAFNFRLGIEALRLGMAHEYDPFFSLSIARVDPLPHQLEAVYDYFLKLPRIRFLLADDPGAGKTIMAGLLVKELKIRGLIRRILIVTPANLTFQWQREMREKFGERFEVIRGVVLRANYGTNPWQEKDQVITSMPWVARIEDAKESLLHSHWDLVIVDEAHKMSAYSSEKKTLAYQLGEALSEMTDHYLLMTATPHKGDPQNFCLFLRLLDEDVYGDVKSLEEAMRHHEAPFYLRRVKEAMVTFPDPDTGKAKTLFTKRDVRTIEFEINSDELDFYDELTSYVEDQSIKAAEDDSARGRALGFTMAMLQRRFASSIYAVRRSLERMRDRREKILADPDGYRRKLVLKGVPENFDDLPEEEQQRIIEYQEEAVASLNPADLKAEIQELARLIDQARLLEEKEIETKLAKLREVIAHEGIFSDPKMKLLIFTEHKDTLDYLVEKLRGWDLSVTQIHGGMKVGSRDEPGTRLSAEREFREDCQVMVATEAAGEGINLQYCWFMINYDIPWNPVRLEQRMGRIHRYGQEKDCLIFNFVAINTREGRVLQKLFERIEKIEMDLDPGHTGKIFNVLGDVLPSNQLEKMLREMYAHNLKEDVIKSRIVELVDSAHLKKITDSTLENSLAKKELNLSAIVGKRVEAKERRLVPEVVEDFFVQAAPLAGMRPKEARANRHIYQIGKVPRSLRAVGDRLESEALCGPLGSEYKWIVFDKDLLQEDATLEWVTPGHPLFECVRAYSLDCVEDDLRRGAVFFDLHREKAARLDVYSAALNDGLGATLNRRLFVVETGMDGQMSVRQPTLFLDLVPAPPGTKVPKVPGGEELPGREEVERYLYEVALQPFREDVSLQRKKEVETVLHHAEISLNTIIDRVQCQFADLHLKRESGSKEQGLEGRIKLFDDRLSDLNNRLERRRAELEKELHCFISDLHRLGSSWVIPHPERDDPGIASMVRDEEIERIAVDAVIACEEARGWKVESVESENRGFDLISRRLHPEDPNTPLEIRFIEVKGRATMGEVALTENEYKTAARLKEDYWLYAVFNCATEPEVNPIQNPARLGWAPVVKVEHYKLGADEILGTRDD